MHLGKVRQDSPATFRLPQEGTVHQAQGIALVVTHKLVASAGPSEVSTPIDGRFRLSGIWPGIYALSLPTFIESFVPVLLHEQEGRVFASHAKL